MVYSTCSFDPIQNEAIVADLLRKNRGTLELGPCCFRAVQLSFGPVSVLVALCVLILLFREPLMFLLVLCSGHFWVFARLDH